MSNVTYFNSIPSRANWLPQVRMPGTIAVVLVILLNAVSQPLLEFIVVSLPYHCLMTPFLLPLILLSDLRCLSCCVAALWPARRPDLIPGHRKRGDYRHQKAGSCKPAQRHGSLPVWTTVIADRACGHARHSKWWPPSIACITS